MLRVAQRITRTILLVLALQAATAATRYVDVNSANPTPPYTNWATAAAVIQDALDAAEPGDEVVVTNGVYATGGRQVAGDKTTNRVAVTKPLTLRSVNGSEVNMIQGYQVPVTGWGTEAIRCVYLTDGAVLSGFTLANGATSVTDYGGGSGGGGVHCESTKPMVTNCIITANVASGQGGGACLGTLDHCTPTHGWAPAGGGAAGSVLNNCKLARNSARMGGGAVYCTLKDNFADGGGGIWSGTLNHCLLMRSEAFDFGGGAAESTLNNCTLLGDAYGGVLNNCIVSYNELTMYGNVMMNYCCTPQLPARGVGNITNEPAFVDPAGGDFRLHATSPCIDAGNNTYVADPTDLDGNPRIFGGTVDIGAFEFQAPTSLLSYAWAQQYGLPTDGSADFTDPETDQLNNWQEWRSGTIPTNALSVLRLLTPVSDGSNLLLTWESVTNRSYFLERCAGVYADSGIRPARRAGLPCQPAS